MNGISKEVEEIRIAFRDALRAAETIEELRKLKVEFLGKKGKVTLLSRSLGKLSKEDRPAAGQAVNEVRLDVDRTLENKIQLLEAEEMRLAEKREWLDVTLSQRGRMCGGIHPVAQVTYDVIEILQGLGFSVALGPEIEEDFYNFEALNIPSYHPARDMQDTFYFDDSSLLRTHTSPVQIRSMLKWGAPIRIACPGKVYRRDSDPTHSPMFHQIEGLLVDEGISIADLKGCFESLIQSIFDRPLKARYRASYFPFTEPSMEVDIECIACSGKDPHCRICKGTGWLEVAGMGMVHPNVLRAGKVDTDKYNGFAWGMGLDRIAMLKYDLHDLRTLFEGDAAYLLSGRND